MLDMWQKAARLCLVLLAFSIPAQISCQKKYEKRWSLAQRAANWTALLSQPLTFVNKAQYRLKKRPGGYKPGPECGGYVGLGYLDAIRRTRYTICGIDGGEQPHQQGANTTCTEVSSCSSAVYCYNAPILSADNSSEGTVSLCRSHNLVLDTCKFFEGVQTGTPSNVPLPARGAVKLACPLAQVPRKGIKTKWLRNVHTDMWWGNATQDDAAVFTACAPNSTTLVTTPTLFLTRHRHANYAAEVEALSMVFAFLAALQPHEVAAHGIQVVVADQAPPTGFLETWARLSRPYPLRMLARDPFPPDTCFRSAYHVYTAAGGLGFNMLPSTIKCESPLMIGFSHWLRQLYGEPDLAARMPFLYSSAEAVAGPAAEAAGVRGLRPAAGGIVLRNVVWLSRRSLELLRMVLNATTGWQSVRMVRNEDAVVAGIMAAVQEWNAASCLVRRFDRAVKSAYELSLTEVNPVHAATFNTTWTSGSESGPESGTGQSGAGAGQGSAATSRRRGLGQRLRQRRPKQQTRREPAKPRRDPELQRAAAQLSGGSVIPGPGRRSLATADGAALDAEGDFWDDEGSEGDEGDDVDDGSGDGFDEEGDVSQEDGDGGAGGGTGVGGGHSGNSSHPFMIGSNTVALDRLWQLDVAAGDACRRTNVLFKYVEADFLHEPYDTQLRTIFRAGVLAGVHGAGLAHSIFMPPGQSAVLQLLGEKFAQMPVHNVFRNMAANVGNHYEDVPYGDVDVDIERLKAAVKRAMDFVATEVMAAQVRRTGALKLVLVDQSHFSIVVPSQQHCPWNATARARRVTVKRWVQELSGAARRWLPGLGVD